VIPGFSKGWMRFAFPPYSLQSGSVYGKLGRRAVPAIIGVHGTPYASIGSGRPWPPKVLAGAEARPTEFFLVLREAKADKQLS
jgi:hypothetical protein